MLPLVTKQVFAETDKAKQVINALGIMNTDQGDNSEGTARVTRDRFAQMLVNLSLQKGIVSKESNVSLFKDVSKKYWAAGYIQTAITRGWMSGYLNGSFKPNKGITLQEAVKAVAQLLGYTSSDFSGNLIGGQTALYVSKNLNKNIDRSKTSYLSVNDCINLLYNTLNATAKDGRVYAETLGYILNSNGELDYMSLINVGIEGPVIVDDNWKLDIPFSTDAAIYYKNGTRSSYYRINDYDVLYYSDSLKTIWAYDEKVTGTLESVNPNQLSPQSITVSGKDYTLQTSEMSIEFSTLGNVKEGDIITLLLGKDRNVVGVLDIDEYNTTITGVVLEIGEHISDDSEGFIYTKYIIFVDAAGNEYQQDYDEAKMYLTEGNLVRVSYEDGKASISKYELQAKTFGNNTFSSDGSRLGDVSLASNVKILDIMNKQYKDVYPARLAGVIVSASVIYYELDDNGEIAQLILNNVTGDLYQYGIFTGFNVQGDKAAYGYVIDGVKGSLTSNSLSNFDINIGPKGFVFDEKELTGTFGLSEENVISLGKTSVQVKDAKYPLAEEYDVYYLKNGEYIMTTIDKVSDLSKYELIAYYDGAVSLGGRVRIIVAKSKA